MNTEVELENRKKALVGYLQKLGTPGADETFAVFLDLIGYIHTPEKGAATLAVPIVQLTALLGYIADQFTVAISRLKLSASAKLKLQRAYSKLFWIQNSMFIRHYTQASNES